MRFNDMLLKILEFIRDNYDNLFKTKPNDIKQNKSNGCC